MAATPPDDLDALRSVVEALKPFDPKDQERIVRWAREKLGLSPSGPDRHAVVSSTESRTPTQLQSSDNQRLKDVKSFVDAKNPQSENQFAATVAYFYRFEAPETERKMDIAADDLQDAARKAGRERLKHPSQTLVNAHGQGYFDKADRGRYALNTVGENLVAMALPQGLAKPARTVKAKRPATRSKK